MGTQCGEEAQRYSRVKEELIWGIVNANSSLYAVKNYLVVRAKFLKKGKSNSMVMTIEKTTNITLR